jgi:hypothetical protein
MSEVLDSLLLKNLKDGKLPDFNVNVEVTEKTLFNIFLGLFLVGLALMISHEIFKVATK